MNNDNSEHNSPLSTSPRVLFFSGKGGVGKTTLAGTASLYLAKADEKVLVASTDPAHSLSDLFAQKLSWEATEVASGVDAVEVDATGAVDRMFAGMGPRSEKGAFSGVADLLQAASQSPGVDEVVSLDMLLQLIERPSYQSVVLDTAPTGHTLRLLALPELMDRYFGGLLKLRSRAMWVSRKVKRLFGAVNGLDGEAIEEELAGAQRRLRMLAEMIRNPERCGLVLVTIPEAMSVLETTRTVAFLAKEHIPIAAVLVNMLQPKEPKCSFCTKRRHAQLVQIEKLMNQNLDCPVFTIEHTYDEPRGLARLMALADDVWADHESVLRGTVLDSGERFVNKH